MLKGTIVKKPDLSVSLSGREYSFFGQPGAGVRLESKAERPADDEPGSPDAFVEAVANDVLEAVMLSLYGDGLLTPDVIGSITGALDGISNNFEKLGESAKANRQDSAFGCVAADFHASDDLEFNEKLLIAHADNGAFVQCWQWVSDDDVLAYLEQQISEKHASVEAVLAQLDPPETSLEAMLDSHGVHATFDKLKPFLSKADDQVETNREQG